MPSVRECSTVTPGGLGLGAYCSQDATGSPRFLGPGGPSPATLHVASGPLSPPLLTTERGKGGSLHPPGAHALSPPSQQVNPLPAAACHPTLQGPSHRSLGPQLGSCHSLYPASSSIATVPVPTHELPQPLSHLQGPPMRSRHQALCSCSFVLLCNVCGLSLKLPGHLAHPPWESNTEKSLPAP